ncbi:MAG: methionine synthase [Streptococcaceae bacterium]|jgi:hypothetical protein|nr:methionine synthase [Streptococcaceae bacterium]
MEDLFLDKREVLRYLGYRKKQALTPEISQLIDEEMLEIKEVAKARYTYQVYDIEPDYATRAIKVLDTTLVLSGENAFSRLYQAEKVALFAGTLGIEVDRRLAMYARSDVTRGLILDACAVEYIEKVMDVAERKAVERFEGWRVNRRFSPGYGDLPLAIQGEFLAACRAERVLGIQLTSAHLMIPRKSVTAFVGLFNPND